MRYLTIKGVQYDLVAMQDYLRVYGEEACGSEAKRDELIRDLAQARQARRMSGSVIGSDVSPSLKLRPAVGRED